MNCFFFQSLQKEIKRYVPRGSTKEERKKSTLAHDARVTQYSRFEIIKQKNKLIRESKLRRKRRDANTAMAAFSKERKLNVKLKDRLDRNRKNPFGVRPKLELQLESVAQAKDKKAQIAKKVDNITAKIIKKKMRKNI